VKRRIVLLGPPAAGKGTQAEKIEARYKIPITSPGAILRDEKRAGTELGIEADKLTSQGKLLPDTIVVSLVRHWLSAHDGAFVFDGFPRSIGQAEALEAMLDERGTPLEVVIALEADFATLERRVAGRLMCSVCRLIVSIGLHVGSTDDPCPRCGGPLARRSDDTPEVLAERMRQYHEKTAPLLGFYETRGMLRRVDSSRDPEVVFGDVAAILEHA
jgi:adenylate kinase